MVYCDLVIKSEFAELKYMITDGMSAANSSALLTESYGY